MRRVRSARRVVSARLPRMLQEPSRRMPEEPGLRGRALWAPARRPRQTVRVPPPTARARSRRVRRLPPPAPQPWARRSVRPPSPAATGLRRRPSGARVEARYRSPPMARRRPRVAVQVPSRWHVGRWARPRRQAAERPPHPSPRRAQHHSPRPPQAMAGRPERAEARFAADDPTHGRPARRRGPPGTNRPTRPPSRPETSAPTQPVLRRSSPRVPRNPRERRPTRRRDRRSLRRAARAHRRAGEAVPCAGSAQRPRVTASARRVR